MQGMGYFYHRFFIYCITLKIDFNAGEDQYTFFTSLFDWELKDFSAPFMLQIKLGHEVKSFLTLPKEYRDMSQLQRVLHGLEVVKSFSEYPLHMQEKLAKVAWYQE